MSQESALDIKERFHPRVEANFMVKVLMSGKCVVAKAQNLSMNGLYLKAFPLGGLDRFTVAIPLPGDREIVTTCLVKRQHMDGVALEFESLDWDDMIAIARFLHPRLPG
ncbi:MAG: PilZ domain-containing protein [Myxococcaceae bacterium]